jgi:SAM-dependent methyltransferase
MSDDPPSSASLESVSVVSIGEAEIRKHGPGRLPAVCWRQWRTERRLRRLGIDFRTTDVQVAKAAYAAMSELEFEAINGRQDWANWRTIPRSISGLVPGRPLRIVDLGCGSGGSTRVLAFYAPTGSKITAYELARPLVNVAASREYAHKGGEPADVEFVCQGVAQHLCTPSGKPLEPGSVDLANASGVVGHHFSVETIGALARELRRLIVPGGIAELDVGPTLSAADLTAAMSAVGFERVRRTRSFLLDPTGQVVFRVEGRKE